MDERIVENRELEEALEYRESERATLAEARAAYQTTHQKVTTMIDALHLEDGDVIRVGRFRITKQLVPAHEVTFEAEEAERIRIRAEG